MNTLLVQFLKDYMEWVNTGADKSHTVFNRHSGLCLQIDNYMKEQDLSVVNTAIVKKDFRRLLFNTCSGKLTYPFNKNGTAYIKEALSGKCHVNKQRINWVKEQLDNA